VAVFAAMVVFVAANSEARPGRESFGTWREMNRDRANAQESRYKGDGGRSRDGDRGDRGDRGDQGNQGNWSSTRRYKGDGGRTWGGGGYSGSRGIWNGGGNYGGWGDRHRSYGGGSGYYGYRSAPRVIYGGTRYYSDDCYAPRVRYIRAPRYRSYVSFGIGLGYYCPVRYRSYAVAPPVVDQRDVIDVENLPPAGCYYYDPYCQREFSDLDSYTDHIDQENHAQTIEIRDRDSGDYVRTLVFLNGYWEVQR
jgi:hypothetical protein